MEVPVLSLDFPPDTEIVRGYNISRSYNISIHNLNNSLYIVELEPPDVNFDVSIYFTDSILTSTNTPSMVVEMGVDMPYSMLAQEVANDSVRVLAGDMDILVPREDCASYQYICVNVSPGLGSSYRLPIGYEGHIHCIDATALINCIGKLPPSFDFIANSAMVMVGEIVSFDLQWSYATDAIINVTFDDSTVDFQWDWLVEGHTEHYLAFNTTTNHLYTVNNNYTVMATITNDVGSVSNDTEITVEPDLDTAISISVVSTPQPSPVDVSFQVILTFSSPSPVLVWCDVDFDDGNTSSLFGVITNHEPMTFDHHYTVDAPDVSAAITCYNHVSNKTKSQLVILRADFDEVEFFLNLTEPAAATGDTAIFSITMANGSHAQFIVNYGDGNVDNYIHHNRLSDQEPFPLEHVFAVSGNYTVEVYAWNEHFNSTTNDTIVVQNAVHDLTLTGPSFVAFPSGLSTLSLQPVDGDLLPPDNVFCEWVAAPDISQVLYDIDIAGNLPSTDQFNYGLHHVTGEKIQVNTTCYNLASRQEDSWFLEVFEVISGLFTVLDPPYIGRGEEFLTHVSLASGSSVYYAVDWDDSYFSNESHPQLFANTSLFTFGHTYTSVGNYSLTVTASNRVGWVEDGTQVFIVQNRITDLILMSNESVLWPNGLMEFNITTGTLQQDLLDVHCVWDFQTGERDHSYVAILDASNPFQKAYEFPRYSVGTADVTVNCSNLISSISLNITVEIILDQVILDSFNETGSVHWQNISTFNFHIIRFGSYSCYELDMGDGEIPVIYGVRACIPYITTHGNTFTLIEYSNLTITHEYEYEWPGTYLVVLRGFNHVNNATLNTTHVVIDWPCYHPNITLPSLFNDTGIPYEHMKSKTFRIAATFTQYCWKTTGTAYNWSIISMTTGDLIAEIPNNKTFFHFSRMLNYDDYYARFYVAMDSHDPARYNVDGIESTEDAIIRIIPTPLRVKIKGGLADGAAFDRKMDVNSIDVTFDLDTGDWDKSGMEFMWFCKLAVEEWPMDGDWIDRSSPSGGGGCYGNGAGTMGETEGFFTINTGEMNIKTLYHITVEVSKDIRRGKYEQEFYVGLVDPPVMTNE